MFLGSSLLRRSLNYRSLAAGQAYPLFYDTLFADLRGVFTQAAATARQAGAGLWAQDHSQTGLAVTTQAALEQQGVVFPKLFRRLSEFLAQPQPGGLAGFLPWLAASEEQVLDLTQGQLHPFRQRRRGGGRPGAAAAATGGAGVRQRQDHQPNRGALASPLT